MKIVLLNDDSLPLSKGGAAVVMDSLMQGYKDNGHDVTLITTHQDETKGEIMSNGNVISILSNYPSKYRHHHCLGNPKMSSMLSQVFEEIKPDAVHAHNIHAHLTYEGLLIAKKYTSRIILTAHDVFLVAFSRVRGRRFESLALKGKPVRMHWWEHLLSVGRKYWPLRNATIRRILKESGTKVVAISEAQKKFLEANNIKVAAVIHNSTQVSSPVSQEDVNAFRNHLKLTGPTILFGGRLSEDKGIRVLLEAFKILLKNCPSAQILITGESDRVADVFTDFPELKDSIVHAGWLSQKEMRQAYAASAVVTTPSLCFDPFNIMNIEAMANGKPVVASVLGGAPEIIDDGVTGTIVNPRDTEQFAKALTSLLSNPEKAEEMGRKGRERVEQNFSLEKQSNKYIQLLNICNQQPIN
ncbi:glycosyltransferase family 4 protein [Patescibacteria group bacterium]|nr:glycosyltransferase family 4 protein [Patescibacteria group bacterium]